MSSEEEDVEEWDEEEDWETEEEEEGGGADDLSSLDLKSMEEEAIDAVRQYSQSLSTELGFGIGSFSFISFPKTFFLSNSRVLRSSDTKIRKCSGITILEMF